MSAHANRKVKFKRYAALTQSHCLKCGKWLCVTAGAYTGDVRCQHCNTINVFIDSLRPVEMVAA